MSLKSNPTYLYPKGIEITLPESGNQAQARKKKRINYLLLALLILLLLLVPVVSSYFLIRQRAVYIGEAAGVSDSKVQIENSYLFASPLKAKKGGERIRVTVFVLNSKGVGLMGKTVVLGIHEDLTINDIHPVTDELGRAYFDIYSNSLGVYSMEAVVDGMALPQKVTIAFE